MHTKVLNRTQTYSEHYQQWLHKGAIELLEILSGSYANGVFGKGADDLDYEQLPTFKRLTWHPEHLIHQELSFLFDYFMLRLVQNNYLLSLSDERHEIFDSGTRLTIHRHHLKPDSDVNYGNIILEHRFNSHINSLIIISNNNGRDGMTTFEKLMEMLLE
ncbi:MAG: hypothetical protein V4613_12225 [Bacteroidota bacterium]